MKIYIKCVQGDKTLSQVDFDGPDAKQEAADYACACIKSYQGAGMRDVRVLRIEDVTDNPAPVVSVAENAAKAGATKTPAKAATSAANGAKGGRPKKP